METTVLQSFNLSKSNYLDKINQLIPDKNPNYKDLVMTPYLLPQNGNHQRLLFNNKSPDERFCL
jgi:hypothetical protein